MINGPVYSCCKFKFTALLIQQLRRYLRSFYQSSYCAVVSIVIEEIPLTFHLIPSSVHSSEGTVMYIMEEVTIAVLLKPAGNQVASFVEVVPICISSPNQRIPTSFCIGIVRILIPPADVIQNPLAALQRMRTCGGARAAAGTAGGTAAGTRAAAALIRVVGLVRIGVVRIVRVIGIFRIGIIGVIGILRIGIVGVVRILSRLHLYGYRAILNCQVSGPYQFKAFRYRKLAGIDIIVASRNFYGLRTYDLTIFIYIGNGNVLRLRLLIVLADIDYESAFCYKRISKSLHGVAFRYVLCQFAVIEDSVSVLIYEVVSSSNYIAVLVYKLCINDSRSVSYYLQLGSLSDKIVYKRIASYNQLISFRYIQLGVVEDSISVFIYEVVSSSYIIALGVCEGNINDSRSISYYLQLGGLSDKVAYKRITSFYQLIAFRYIQLRVVEDSISVFIYEVVSSAYIISLGVCEYNIDNSVLPLLPLPGLLHLLL